MSRVRLIGTYDRRSTANRDQFCPIYSYLTARTTQHDYEALLRDVLRDILSGHFHTRKPDAKNYFDKRR